MRAPPKWDRLVRARGPGGDRRLRAGLRVNVADHALDAAVAGAGVSLSFKLIASDDIHAGRLVCPFGPELPLGIRLPLRLPERATRRKPKVRAFREWLFAEMEETKAKWAALPPR